MIRLLSLVKLGLCLGVAGVVYAKPVATVNDTVITDADLRSHLSHLNEGKKGQVLGTRVGKNRAVKSLIRQEVLHQEARRQKLHESRDFKNALKAFERSYLAGMLVGKRIVPQMSEKAARKDYQAHFTRYSSSMIHAHHILLETAEKAKRVKQAIKKGMAFQVAAEKFSKDPSARTNRGNLGFFPRDRFSPAFSDAAFLAKPNEIVGPVKTEFGYHLIKVVGFRPGPNLGFEEVEFRVRQDLQEDLVRAYSDQLRDKAKIKVQ